MNPRKEDANECAGLTRNNEDYEGCEEEEEDVEEHKQEKKNGYTKKVNEAKEKEAGEYKRVK